MESQNLSETPQKSSKAMPSSSASASPSPLASFKSKKILRSTSKSNPSDPETPSKPMQLRSRARGGEPKSPLPKKVPALRSKAKPSVKLPERYELLARFFDNLQSTIRLLKLKRTVRSFTNICPGVESLSERRFCYTHLAQMKYILPEAIELKKVVSVDPKTCCTVPDLEVSLLLDAVESDGGNGYSNLSKLFRTRLLEFDRTHSEEDDIPFGELPEPFNKQIQTSVLSLKGNYVSPVPVQSLSNVLPRQSNIAASHLSQSFKTRFTQREPISEAEKSQLLSTAIISSGQSEEAGLSIKTPASMVPPDTDVVPKQLTIDNTTSKPVKVGDGEGAATMSDDCFPKEILVPEATPTKFTSTPVISTPKKPIEVEDEEVKAAKNIDYSLKENLCSEGTPAKLLSTPARLMSTTPDLQTPKRCHIIQETASTPSPNKLARRPPKRPLFNTPIKKTKSEEEVYETKASSSNAYLINLLPEALRDSIMEKENITNKKHEIAISHAKWRRQMIACLPKLFNMIHLMFQSIKGRIITKEELMHKIITRHLDIIDRAELEEQLKLLEELVPDWIQEKVASSGDVLLCINKSSCPDSVRRRLTEAY